MNIAIRYDSKTGNTEKLAYAIGEEVGVKPERTDAPLTEKADILFLGSSVYAAGVSSEIKSFIDMLSGENVGRVYCFGTAALLPSSYPQVFRLLRAKGIDVAQDEFHCRGSFKFLHKGKPDSGDIENVKRFAARAAGESK